jgi:hypothetical protein
MGNKLQKEATKRELAAAAAKHQEKYGEAAPSPTATERPKCAH